MKWNVKNYRRDTLTDIIKAHGTLDGTQKFRKVRASNEGIYYEQKINDKWERGKLNQKQIDTIIMELYG